MHCELDQSLLRIKLLLWSLFVNYIILVASLDYFLLLKQVLEVVEVGCVAGHVRGEDDADEALPERLEVVS